MIGLARGVLNRRKNVFLLQKGIISEDLFVRCSRCEEVQKVGDPYPETADTGTSATLSFLDRDPL